MGPATLFPPKPGLQLVRVNSAVEGLFPPQKVPAGLWWQQPPCQSLESVSQLRGERC